MLTITITPKANTYLLCGKMLTMSEYLLCLDFTDVEFDFPVGLTPFTTPY